MAYQAPDTSVVLWDEKDNPYWAIPSTGGKHYIPPAAAVQYRDNPRLAAWGASKGASIESPGGGRPGGNYVKDGGTWNTETGEWDQPINWANLALAGITGVSAASALAGGAAGSSVAGPSVAGATEAGVLPSTVVGTGMTTLPGVVSSGAVPAALGTGALTLDRVRSLLAEGKTLGDILGATGDAVGKVGQAAEDNRLTADDQQVRANNSNISGRAAYESALSNRSRLESEQRSSALKDTYRSSYAKNATAGPFNTRGLTPYSEEYMQSLSALEQQALARLMKEPEYGTDTMAPIPPYVPFVPNTSPGTTEKVSNWLAPGLSVTGQIAEWLKSR